MQLVPWTFQSDYGFTLHGEHSRPSGKPILHLLHGNGYNGRTYLPMLRLLNEHFDLFLSDIQGHGDSETGGKFIGWNESAELALKAFQAHRDVFGDVKVYAIGHSLGGVLTALINSRQDSPFEKVVLLDPVIFTPGMLTVMQSLSWLGLYQYNPLAAKAKKRRSHWPDRQSAYNYLYQRGMFRNWHHDSFSAYIDHALNHDHTGVRLKCPAEREAEIFASYPKSLWTHLKQSCSPTLLIYGDATFPFIQKSASKWQTLNPSLLIRQQKGGHCFMQEQPQHCYQQIVCFLADSQTKPLS